MKLITILRHDHYFPQVIYDHICKGLLTLPLQFALSMTVVKYEAVTVLLSVNLEQCRM